MKEVITEIAGSNSFKGLMRIYIDEGLQQNPDELICELYCQIKHNQPLSNEVMGKRVVDLILQYFENASN
jgi:hypothetical protein